MAIRSDVYDRNLTPGEEKLADTNKDGTVSKEELKAFEEKYPNGPSNNDFFNELPDEKKKEVIKKTWAT